MQISNKLRKIAPIVALVALVMAATSCTSTKKYGCPNKLEISAFFR